mgnify:CR=1 FL=1
MESQTDYALCVSFEVWDTELDIYNLMATAQIEIPIDQEIEAPGIKRFQLC